MTRTLLAALLITPGLGLPLSAIADATTPQHTKLLGPTGGLRNISTNGQVDSTGMLAGFIVEGGNRRFAITGEALSGSILDATVVLTSLDGSITYDSNTSWQQHPSAEELQTDLRPLGRDSDAGFVVALGPGAYVARLSAEDGIAARGVISVTDISGTGNGGLRNISTNGLADDSGMLAGFIVEGSTRPFAITGENLQGSNLDAALELTNLNRNITFASNRSWQQHPSAEELQTSLRPLGQASDAGFTVELGPGVYLARLYPQDGVAARGLISITDTGQPSVELQVDLRVRSLGLVYNPDNGEGELRYIVRNSGDEILTITDWNINLVLSPDATIGNGNDIFLFTENADVVLGPGDDIERDENNTASFNLYRSTAGDRVPAGDYYLAVYVDDQQQIIEPNEENNSLALENLIEVP